jgi:predicted regulator of Ras-like GTPase activity (Roadblock/LC7/MglB family)
MRLRQILEELVKGLPGATAAVLADWEGEAVAAFCAGRGSEEEEYNIRFVGAHHGIILTRAREMIARLAQGEARELVFSHQYLRVLTVPVNHEYYVVLTLEARAWPFLARSALRRAVAAIEAEIQ